MYVKVEPSGCCEDKGLVRVRLDMFLDPEDYGYEKRYVQLPVIPAEGYRGEVDKIGMPADTKDYRAWKDSLPKVWQNNPFHSHFIYVEFDTTDKEIMDIGEAFLHECYIKWALDLGLASFEHQPRNNDLPFVFPETVTLERRATLDVRVQSLKTTTLERKV